MYLSNMVKIWHITGENTMAIDYDEVGKHLAERLSEEKVKQYKIPEQDVPNTQYETGFMVKVATDALKKYGSALFDPPRPDEIDKKIINVAVQNGTIIKKENGDYKYNLTNGKNFSVDSYGLSTLSEMACDVAHETTAVAKERNPQAGELIQKVENLRRIAGMKGNGGFSQAYSELSNLERIEERGLLSFKGKVTAKDNSQTKDMANDALKKIKSNEYN